MKILMLAPVMIKGYGLSEVIAALVPELAALGVDCEVGCLDADGSFPELRIHHAGASAEEVLGLVGALEPDVVIAHGSPFLEALPVMRGMVTTVAYEHGEPPAEMFVDDRRERAERARYKLDHVYPDVTHVVAISDFIRADIAWPDAVVIRNGADHVPDLGAKPWLPPRGDGEPLRVGLLMRLGPGEARYKGNDVLPELRRLVDADGTPSTWEVMGRGTPADRDALVAAGFTVHLNATDEERTQFLRDIDVFVSLSKWEGCNLPLVEAQALGTPGLALDTGAHPEFTPLVFRDVGLLAEQIRSYSRSPELLRAHGEMSYRYVTGLMAWRRTAADLVTLLAARPELAPRSLRLRARLVRVKAGEKWRNARDLYRERGMGAVAQVAAGKLRGGS